MYRPGGEESRYLVRRKDIPDLPDVRDFLKRHPRYLDRSCVF